MARNRVFFNELNLFVGPTGEFPCTGKHFGGGNTGDNLVAELHRVQSASLDFSLNPTDIQEFGRADRVDAIFLDSPTVNLQFTYFPLDGVNESRLGFKANDINGSFLSGILTEVTDTKNYFLTVSPAGINDDSNNSQTNRNVISIGNAYITNYTFSASVGQVPTVNVSVDGFNVRFDTGTSQKTIPAVNPSNGQTISTWNFTIPTGVTYTGAAIPAALRPGEIQLELPMTGALGQYMSGSNSFHLQSFNLSIPMSRTDIGRIGTLFDFAKPLSLPLTATLTLDALVTELRAGSLSDLLCNYQNHDFRIKLKNPACPGTAAADAIWIDFRNAKLQSESFGFGIGNNATTSATFTAQISAGNSATSGPFFSGINATA